MDIRAILLLFEKSRTYYFVSAYGANELSPLLYLEEAKRLQDEEINHQSISFYLEHLDLQGNYHKERLADELMFYKLISHSEYLYYSNKYIQSDSIEMRFIIHMDDNGFQFEYNQNCTWYRTMGTYSKNIDTILGHVAVFLEQMKKNEINNFELMLFFYQRSIGLEDKLKKNRSSMNLGEYVDSHKWFEDKERYDRLLEQLGELHNNY